MLKIENVFVQYAKKIALDNITLTLAPGKTLAVIGESGAGKSTLIAAILGLVKLKSGIIHWEDKDIYLCQPSLVMQEPRAAFNPALSLRQSILEPIVAKNSSLSDARLSMLCKHLELPIQILERKPHQVSIGQAQRAGILRALISDSPIILFDEPLSALDAINQKQTASLIHTLQQELGFAALIVTHDIGYASAYSDHIAVLRNGKIEETTATIDFNQRPSSSYGRELLSAAFSLGSLETAI